MPVTLSARPKLGKAHTVLPDLLVFSHLRWDFVFQRPQQIMTRLAAGGSRVLFVEEPLRDSLQANWDISPREGKVWVAVPHIPTGLTPPAEQHLLSTLMDELLIQTSYQRFISWYYTPAALEFSQHLKPVLTVYDCMDELSAFAFAPPKLKGLEQQLLQRADVVFTGGYSLYEAKKHLHPHVFAFPSSVDVKHFAQARTNLPQPTDQVPIPYPRLGFFGVIDERMDLELIRYTAAHQPAWQLVLVGPVVKIDPNSLPQANNIHYLGSKKYQQLPAYLAGWQVALLPFATNESTRYISPTKTPEYLAAGKPVVSTAIKDVVQPYEELGLVAIGRTPEDFVAAAAAALQPPVPDWLPAVDAFLATNSWDHTVAQMTNQLTKALLHA